MILVGVDSGRHHLHDVQPNCSANRQLSAFWGFCSFFLNSGAISSHHTTLEISSMDDQAKYAIHAAAREGKSESTRPCLSTSSCSREHLNNPPQNC